MSYSHMYRPSESMALGEIVGRWRSGLPEFSDQTDESVYTDSEHDSEPDSESSYEPDDEQIPTFECGEAVWILSNDKYFLGSVSRILDASKAFPKAGRTGTVYEVFYQCRGNERVFKIFADPRKRQIHADTPHFRQWLYTQPRRVGSPS